MVKVLDASALMAYLEKEPGYERVENLLSNVAESEAKSLMTTVNFGEVFYLIIKEKGLEEAEKILQLLRALPIDIVSIDWELAKQAATYKATKNLPYADCFAAALAKREEAELITLDKDFKKVNDEIKIVWLI